MAEARWKAKPKGFATIKKGGYWVKPQREVSAPRGGTPRGGTASTTTRTAALNKLPPRDYVGSEGLIGSWKKEPRLNPDQYEWQLNPENNRWFARPRTETTGLDFQQRADLSAFDRQTGAQSERIGEAYSNYATQASADRDAGAKAFGTLANLSASGYTDATSGSAPGPYGAVQGRPLSQAEQALPGVLAQGARESNAAAGAQSLFALSQIPTLARDAGVTAQSGYTATRQGQRSEFLSSARETAEIKAAALSKTHSDLRAQNLSLLGKKIGAGTTLKTAKIRANTAKNDRAAKLGIEAAKLRNQAEIARERNLVSRANTLDNLAAKKEAAAKKAKKASLTPATQRAWTKRAREMWDGVPRTTTDANGDSVKEYVQYSSDEILRELMASGATRAQAIRIARLVTNHRSIGRPASPGAVSTIGGALF